MAKTLMNEFEYDLAKIEEKARQMRAEALREGLRAIRVWFSTRFNFAPKPAAKAAV